MGNNNQPKKYRNFMIGAASAALVATAVAPVASAAEFSDVSEGNTHAPAIKALVDAGVINGYPDGTFKPNKTLTRSDVVKMMGKWLESLDYKVPADYKTNPRFKDHTSKTNDELLKYSALVKDNGVFNGYPDGTLGAGLDITRENMAIVLVRAYDAIHKTDLVTLVGEKEFDKDVIDLAKAKAEARPYIDVLDYFDITNPVAPQFNPKNTTTRGQFASFLYKTSNVEVGEDTEAPKLAYTGEKTINVEYDAKFNIPVVTATDNVDKNVKVTSVITNEAGERISAIDTKEAGTYKVTYSAVDAAGNNAEDLVLTVVVAEPAIPEVLSVSALNPMELQVKLNKAVSPESVATSDFKVTATGADTTVTVNDVQLSSNGKTATLLLATKIPSAGVDVSINEGALLAKNYDKFVKFSATAVKAPEDKTAPKLLAAEFVGGKDIQLTFDEPVDWAANSPVVKIDSTSVDAPSVSTEAGKYVYTISAASNLSNGKHTVELRNVTDFAGNKEVLITNEVTVDTTAAKVVSVKAQDSTSFIVELSKAVTASGITKSNFEIKKGNFVLGESNIESINLVDSKGQAAQGTSSKFVKVSLRDSGPNTANPLYSADETSINLAVKISGYKDASSVLGTEYSGNVTLSKDTAAPTIKSEKLITSTATKIVVPFDRTISGVDKDKVTVKQGNVLVTPTDVSVENGNLVLTFSADTLQNGKTYNVTLSKGAVTASNSVVNEAASFSYTVPAADVTYKVPSSAIAEVTKESGRNVITINYAAKVSDEAGLAASYKLDNSALPAGTDVYFIDSTQKVVKILLPASYKVSTEDKSAKLTVVANTVKFNSNGAFVSGNSSSATAYEEVIELKDNVAPTIQKVEYVKDSNGFATGLKLTFSENVDTSAYTADDQFVIKQGSTTISYTVQEDVATAKDNVVNLTFANDTNVTASNVTLATNPSKQITLADLNGNVLEAITSAISAQ